jgi:hypothetical protein
MVYKNRKLPRAGALVCLHWFDRSNVRTVGPFNYCQRGSLITLNVNECIRDCFSKKIEPIYYITNYFLYFPIERTLDLSDVRTAGPTLPF